jgi:hypothetical protein
LIGSTETALLDAQFGSTRGMILYRNATVWTALAAGTSGQFLETLGSSANPVWATPPRTVAGTGWYVSPETVPLAAAFTPFGANITLTDKSDRLQVNWTAQSGNHLQGGVQSSISTPYTVDLGMTLNGVTTTGSTSVLGGLCLSNGTGFRAFYAGISSGALNVFVQAWTNLNSAGAAAFTLTNWTGGSANFFLRITDNGTTRSYLLSTDGKTFILGASEPTNTSITPTQFGICFEGANVTTPMTANIYHFLVTASVLGDAP